MINITLPMTEKQLSELRPGDSVLLSGTIYTARDAAHARLCALLDKGEELPFDIKDAVIYYAGPCPAKPGQVINSCGPTTSGRMDAYAPKLYAAGAQGAIGNGVIGDGVKEAMAKHGGIYFLAVGGAGALISHCVTSAEVVAFEELGAEAIRRLTIKDLPVIVGVDCHGDDIYTLRNEI